MTSNELSFDTVETKREKKFSFNWAFYKNNPDGFGNSLIYTGATVKVLLSDRKRRWMVPGTSFGFDRVFSTGNSKLDKSILIFSLLPIATCLNCSECKGSCYAKKACLQYDNTWNKRAMVTYMAVNHMDILENAIVDELSRTKRNKVRIHESGDFFSLEYVAMWSRIVKRFPHIRFYYYTKVEDLPKFHDAMVEFAAIDNVNRVRSLLPNGELNFGSFDYVLALHNKYGYPVCTYGLTDEEMDILGYSDEFHCGANCCICMASEYVLFKEH